MPGSPGEIVDDRWLIGVRQGRGTFGTVFSATDVVTGSDVAIKFARAEKRRKSLEREAAILASLAGCPRTVRLIDARFSDQHAYLVMEEHGPNLARLRAYMPQQVFPPADVATIGEQMLRALAGVHQRGVLHRDVKPANIVFASGYDTATDCILADFGLARRYLDESGEIRPPRARPGSCGTMRYTSVESHGKRELSPRDDLWSLLYSLIELLEGALPWHDIEDQVEVMNRKAALAECPITEWATRRELHDFCRHLQSLGYEDAPDYELLRSLMRSMNEVRL